MQQRKIIAIGAKAKTPKIVICVSDMVFSGHGIATETVARLAHRSHLRTAEHARHAAGRSCARAPIRATSATRTPGTDALNIGLPVKSDRTKAQKQPRKHKDTRPK